MHHDGASMNLEDVQHFILQWIRDGSPSRYSSYGYDVYIPNVIRAYLSKKGIDADRSDGSSQLKELSPDFYAAAWELCRRGIIRPGVRIFGSQATDDGSGGNGYSVTPFGKQWIEESDKDTFVPTEPGRFSEMLMPFRTLFGLGFYDRSQEAVRCYGAHAYLACCAMCGAAAESILLALAIAKCGNEKEVIKDYSGTHGRQRIENKIIGQEKEHIKRELTMYTSLLKYWRDEAAHGIVSKISDNEAYTSLALLLRFAMYAKNTWTQTTATNIGV